MRRIAAVLTVPALGILLLAGCVSSGSTPSSASSFSVPPATLGSAATWTTGQAGPGALALNGTSAATAVASGPAVDT